MTEMNQTASPRHMIEEAENLIDEFIKEANGDLKAAHNAMSIWAVGIVALAQTPLVDPLVWHDFLQCIDSVWAHKTKGETNENTR